jgi:hypothetical protein
MLDLPSLVVLPDLTGYESAAVVISTESLIKSAASA